MSEKSVRGQINKERTEREFKEWLKTQVKTAPPLTNYPKALRQSIPEKLQALNESKYENLFACNDLQYLKRIQNRLLKGGDLHIFNTNTQNLLPSAALGKFITFLQSVQISTKNIMLYGSPGVGKTHNYKRLISMIEEGASEQEIFNTISSNEQTDSFDNSTFEQIKNEGRMQFVTFHQSYSYEDFIEGFRPQKNGDIVLKNGIFKDIAIKAKNNLDNSYKNLGELEKEGNLLKQFQDYIDTKIADNEPISLQQRGEFYLSGLEGDILTFRTSSNSNVNQTFTLDYKNFSAIYNSSIAKETLRSISEILGTNSIQQKYAYYLQIYRDFKSKYPNRQISKISIDNQQKNYYLIIDEINRGNISKIFGELITLIEEDKRGKKEYEVTLPYSKESFLVPPNLYIIATMNSTDKSIATIDIALRRRFTFLKMLPKLELVANTEAKELMRKLNEYIKKTLGEDYQLGHSYFMKIENEEDLEFVKEYKIKPLLEEYFYGDEANYKSAIELLYKSEPTITEESEEPSAPQ